MPTGLHRAYSRIHALYRSGDRASAQALFERILPILAFSNQHLDVSILFWKRMLWRQGIYPTPDVRASGLRFDAYQEAVADELVERGMEIEAELAAYRPLRDPAVERIETTRSIR
jgi:4-hydroxy-tetrahydrodipicolinate synthase